jgi:hypothetical protein
LTCRWCLRRIIAEPAALFFNDMANEENLKPFTSDQSHEEAVKNGRKGGIKSGESKREKKEFRELLAMVDAMPMKNKAFAEGLRQLGIPEEVIERLDQKLAKVFALQRRCLSGDPQAIKLWLEQIGEHVDTIKHEGLPQQNGDLVLAPKKND